MVRHAGWMVVVAVAIAVCAVEASRGDRSLLFRRLLRWDCDEDCRYACAHSVTDWAYTHDRPVEVASTVFSIGNGIPYLLSRNVWRGGVTPYQRVSLQLYAWVGMCCWLFSAAFHARDVWVTERLDYHCATLLMFCMAYTGIQRLFRLTRRWEWVALTVVCFGVFVAHVAYMNMVHFDYGMNFAVTAAALVVAVVSWVAHTFRAPRPHSWKCRTVMVLTALFGLLDVFDFPPVLHRMIDAHAVWHGSTIPLGFLWWSFLRDEVAFEAAQASKRSR